jgi:hypothetical protein
MKKLILPFLILFCSVQSFATTPEQEVEQMKTIKSMANSVITEVALFQLDPSSLPAGQGMSRYQGVQSIAIVMADYNVLLGDPSLNPLGSQIRDLVLSLEGDFVKFYDKSNGAAGTRLQKGMAELTTLVDQMLAYPIFQIDPVVVVSTPEEAVQQLYDMKAIAHSIIEEIAWYQVDRSTLAKGQGMARFEGPRDIAMEIADYDVLLGDPSLHALGEGIRDLVWSLEGDFVKFYDKENLAASTRTQKGMAELIEAIDEMLAYPIFQIDPVKIGYTAEQGISEMEILQSIASAIIVEVDQYKADPTTLVGGQTAEFIALKDIVKNMNDYPVLFPNDDFNRTGEEIRDILFSLEGDFEKFYNRDNAAAATRTQKGMLELIEATDVMLKYPIFLINPEAVLAEEIETFSAEIQDLILNIQNGTVTGDAMTVYAELTEAVSAIEAYVLAIDDPKLSSQYYKVNSIAISLDKKLVRAIDKGNAKAEERLLKKLARIEFKLTNRISKRLARL